MFRFEKNVIFETILHESANDHDFWFTGGLFVDKIDHSVTVQKENNEVITHNGAPSLGCQNNREKL